MLNRLFGNYLINKGRFAQAELDNLLLNSQDYTAKPETVAIINKVLSPEQVQNVLSLCENGENFTQAALRMELITDEQAELLANLQSNQFMRFMELLQNQQFLSSQDIFPMLSEFQKDNQFTDEQMHALYIDDMNQIARIFVPIHNPQLHELTVTLLQTLKRLIDKNVYLDRAYMAHSLQIDRYASQMITGDINLKLYLTAPMNNLLAIANYFTQDTYNAVDSDALDNVGEFINCVSGLYATNLSYDNINADMDAPEYGMEGPYLNSGKLYVIPIHANHLSFRAVYELPQ